MITCKSKTIKNLDKYILKEFKILDNIDLIGSFILSYEKGSSLSVLTLEMLELQSEYIGKDFSRFLTDQINIEILKEKNNYDLFLLQAIPLGSSGLALDVLIDYYKKRLGVSYVGNGYLSKSFGEKDDFEQFQDFMASEFLSFS